MRDPPVPIPNTEVKPHRAESTWLETAREDRSLPDSNERSTSFDVLLFLYLKQSMWREGTETLPYKGIIGEHGTGNPSPTNAVCVEWGAEGVAPYESIV